MDNANGFTIGIYGIQDVNDSNIPTISHDHGICIMQNGKIVFNIQLERLNRLKHSNAMPEAIYALLKEKKLLGKKHNFVFVDNVLGRSFINREGNIRFEAPLSDTLKNGIETGHLWWLDKNEKAYILNHELAHIGSCLPFYGNFKENSLLIHFDGGASKSNFSAWHYNNDTLRNITFNWGLKKLSSLFNANALTFAMVKAKTFDLNSVPGKFMGFASFGKYNANIEKWLEKHNFFENIWSSKKAFYNAVLEEFNISLNQIDQHSKIIQDIAATIHHIFVRDTLHQITKLKEATQSDYLYYSGGSALNIVLNTELVNSRLFKQIFIPPCCNDSGLAMGAAAFYEWTTNNNIELIDPYANNWSIEDYSAQYSKKTIEQVAQLLMQNKVIGICNGIAEVGPRALGNRSIVSLASSKELAKKVSMDHKKREWYRPVAPIMLKANCKYFTGTPEVNHLAKYMLLDFDILPEKQNEIEGVVHTNRTSRIQTIESRSDNEFMFDLLTYLDEKFGVKALINTSFNIKGEPIVHTTSDAIKSAKNMKLDAVIINGKLQLLTNKSKAQ